MSDTRTITFKIPETRPAELPATLLATYVRDLAVLFGNESVSLVEITDKSTNLAFAMPLEIAVIARERFQNASVGEGTPDENRAFQNIDRNLREHDQSGQVLDDRHSKVVEFPGRFKELLEKYPSIVQPGSLEGIPIRIGGPKEFVPVHLKDGDNIYHCTAHRDVAGDIAQRGMFKAFVQVNGEERWTRGLDGEWYRTRFFIERFAEIVDEESFIETVTRLRGIRDNGWADVAAPIAELERIRYGDA